MKFISSAASLLFLLSFTAISQAQQPGPQQVVKESADAVASLIEERRTELAADQELLTQEVKKLMEGVFDIGYSARLVLGRAGRDATPEQRRRFAIALHEALIRRYAEGILEYQPGKAQIEYLPVNLKDDAKRTRVRTRVITDDGKRIPVDYMLRNTAEGWKAYDVSVEGVSYVTNYRSQFAQEIEDKGIDAVIDRLENVQAGDEITADGDS